MSINTLLRSAAVAAIAVGFAGAASAQATIDAGPSVLERILGDITTSVTTINTGNITSLYANVAGTSLSILNQDPTQVAVVTLDDVLGNIDSSINVSFVSTLVSQPLLSTSESTDAAGNLVTSATYQAMEGTLGDLSTTAIGAVMDATASITTGAVQSVNDTVAGQAMAVSQATAMEPAVLINASLNSANLDAAVLVDIEDYAVAAGGIATTAIGAVGGGTIVAGNIAQLERTVSSFVGMN